MLKNKLIPKIRKLFKDGYHKESEFMIATNKKERNKVIFPEFCFIIKYNGKIQVVPEYYDFDIETQKFIKSPYKQIFEGLGVSCNNEIWSKGEIDSDISPLYVFDNDLEKSVEAYNKSHSKENFDKGFKKFKFPVEIELVKKI